MEYKHGGDIYSHKVTVDFSANINYRGMPIKVRQAAISAVDDSIHYPDASCNKLRRSLANREWEMRGFFDLLPEHFICGNGASELLFALSNAYRPTHALLVLPSFHEYQQILENAGCQIEQYVQKAESGFSLDSDFLQAAASFIRNVMGGADLSGEDGPRPIVILGNPNNPTGTLIRKDILQSVITLCRENHILLVLDESFIDFLNDEDETLTFSGAREAALNPYLFILRSFTKIYAMPGLRFGYGICGNKELLAAMTRVLPPWNVSLVAQEAAAAAADEISFARESARQISFNRKEFVHSIPSNDYRVYPSNANFVLLRGPLDLADYCLLRGYLIRNCDNFPGLTHPGYGLGFFRICIRSQKEMADLLNVLKEHTGKSSIGNKKQEEEDG